MHAIWMEYISTPEAIEGFWNAFAGCSEHQVGAWNILYTLVKVRRSWELLMVVNKEPSSL